MNNPKRYVIHASTNWCGMGQTYPAIAQSSSDLYNLAEELHSFVDDAEYYSSSVEEFTGDKEELPSA